MALVQWLKRRTKPLVFPLIFLSITAYFGWNATQGDRGLVAFAQRKILLQKVQDDQAAAKAERPSRRLNRQIQHAPALRTRAKPRTTKPQRRKFSEA